MSSRTKSKSGWEAAGKPTSMCLKPMCHQRPSAAFSWATVIGSTSAWLPSRRSTAHQSGARSSAVGPLAIRQTDDGERRYLR